MTKFNKAAVLTKTSMSLDGVSTGTTVQTTGKVGATPFISEVSCLTGFDISTQYMGNGKDYTIISIKDDSKVDDPADYAINLNYRQDVKFDEVDLDLNYYDIPEGTFVQAICSESVFTIKKQKISGTHIIGEFATNVNPFESTVGVSLWFDKPEDILPTSKLVLTFSAITSAEGGPTKKEILEKIVLNLSEKPEEGLFVELAATDKTLWGGIVVRSKQGEDGYVPRSVSASAPDIIISGTQPYEDPSFLEKPENYGNSYDAKLTIGMPNYLYVRGKNYNKTDLKGNWNLFYSTPQVLLYPYLWEKNQLMTSSGDKNPAFNIKAGNIGVSKDAFTWVPHDTSDHYCMVAVAKTKDHGNPVAGMNKISSLATYMANNANLAQRNVQMIRGKNADQIINADYNQGAEASTVDLTLIFKNIPLGSKVTASSASLLDGKPLTMTIEKTESISFKYGWPDKDIPADWVTTFTIALNLGPDWTGIPKGQHPEVTIRGELVQAPKDPLYHLGRMPDPHPETNKIRVGACGGPVRVVPVGAVSARMIDMNK